MSDQTEEKSGSGILGLGAATAAGAGAGKLMMNRQTNNLIEEALKYEDAIFHEGGKKAEFATKLYEVASKAPEVANDAAKVVGEAAEGLGEAAEGAGAAAEKVVTPSFKEKLIKAQKDLAKTGEEALSGDLKKAAKVAQKEARIGIKAGMAEAKMPVWRNMTGGQMAKVALVAIPVAIASKLALDAVFGKSHTAKVANDNENRAAEVAAR